jgi:hypothetical protein
VTTAGSSMFDIVTKSILTKLKAKMIVDDVRPAGSSTIRIGTTLTGKSHIVDNHEK